MMQPKKMAVHNAIILDTIIEKIGNFNRISLLLQIFALNSLTLQ